MPFRIFDIADDLLEAAKVASHAARILAQVGLERANHIKEMVELERPVTEIEAQADHFVRKAKAYEGVKTMDFTPEERVNLREFIESNTQSVTSL